MNTDLLKVGVRNQAIYIPSEYVNSVIVELSEATLALVANARKLGFAFSENLLRAINSTTPTYKADILNVLKEITGVNKNWTPLVKGWDVPTGETIIDHFITFFANIFGSKKGTTLACGHLIPDNTFPLERYNGCPFCGTPFEFAKLENYGKGSKLKVLELWSDEEVSSFYIPLLTSKTALDATQVDNLQLLLKAFSVPEGVEIGMKETLMQVIDTLVKENKSVEASKLFKNPTDILRYLWYKHTGFLQIIEPKTIITRKSKNSAHIVSWADKSGEALIAAIAELKLKYTREECRRVAGWLNDLDLPAETACEVMHPKRNMWVRFIRALRLAEYSKKTGFEKLAKLMDVFYNETYTVWQGRINHFRLKMDADTTFSLLKKRPGLFARSLFSNMLWFGADETLKHFREIINKVPVRLILTLIMYAKIYFDKNVSRSVKPLGGTNKRIPANKLLQLFEDKQLLEIQVKIEDLCIEIIKTRFSKEENEHKTMFIEPSLFNIPLAIGDRSETVQDLPSALMGTRFPIEGNTVRLFLQWGNGLPAQHLDMDLSCSVAYENRSDFCSYSQLVISGCKHSGDIQSIPEKVGTAEYIDIDVEKLQTKGAKYVSFTCNAYTHESISPNLVVGWMDSKYPMKISAKTGVAYDPSCIQHQVRITQTLSKGLVFGVLDVEKREILWLEMSFGGQVVQNLNVKGVKALMDKLDSKLNIGYLLQLKAEAQQMEIIEVKEEADEVYDFNWAINSAAVTQLFVD